jgi:predicted ATPase
LREQIRSWRFYDQFRADAEAPARQPQLGTRTPVLSHDGRDLAAALQTIREIGDAAALDAAIEDAFPGARLSIRNDSGRFDVELSQEGLLRSLGAAELSDGILRALHPDLMPALAKLIRHAARTAQVWVVSHSSRLIAALEEDPDCHSILLEKDLGETRVVGQGILDQPAWQWPER